METLKEILENYELGLIEEDQFKAEVFNSIEKEIFPRFIKEVLESADLGIFKKYCDS